MFGEQTLAQLRTGFSNAALAASIDAGAQCNASKIILCLTVKTTDPALHSEKYRPSTTQCSENYRPSTTQCSENYRPSTTQWKIQTQHYTVKTTDPALHSEKYRPSTTQWKLQTQRYTVKITDPALHSENYRPSTTQWKLQTQHYTVKNTDPALHSEKYRPSNTQRRNTRGGHWGAFQRKFIRQFVDVTDNRFTSRRQLTVRHKTRLDLCPTNIVLFTSGPPAKHVWTERIN